MSSFQFNLNSNAIQATGPIQYKADRQTPTEIQ